MKSHRFHLLELVYLAGPYHRPEDHAFNAHLVQLARDYNFPLFVPQEEAAKLAGEDFRHRCLDAMDRSHLMVAVLHGNVFDPHTAFEVGYALGRRHTVLAIQNLPAHAEIPSEETVSDSLLHHAARIIQVSPDKPLTTDRLIPIMNCLF